MVVEGHEIVRTKGKEGGGGGTCQGIDQNADGTNLLVDYMFPQCWWCVNHVRKDGPSAFPPPPPPNPLFPRAAALAHIAQLPLERGSLGSQDQTASSDSQMSRHKYWDEFQKDEILSIEEVWFIQAKKQISLSLQLVTLFPFWIPGQGDSGMCWRVSIQYVWR